MPLVAGGAAVALSSPYLLPLSAASSAALRPIKSANPSSSCSSLICHPTTLPAAVSGYTWKKRSFCVRSKRAFQDDSRWEDPDDGSGSEYEETDDEEEMASDVEGEEATQTGVSNGAMTSKTQETVLLNELQLLLGPEEKAILQQNEAPDLSKISTRKWNPFHTLALSGQIRFMDELLEHGENIDAVDKDGFTALHKAVVGRKEAVINHLLRKGANPHVRDRDGATPLHHAVQVGAMQIVKLLIKYKVDINIPDNDGWTPLHVAIQSRSRDIAKVLLVNGADKTRRNKDGKTPLDLSLCFGKDFKSYDLAKLLKLVPANRDP